MKLQWWDETDEVGGAVSRRHPLEMTERSPVRHTNRLLAREVHREVDSARLLDKRVSIGLHMMMLFEEVRDVSC